jgi:hypothetical protein
MHFQAFASAKSKFTKLVRVLIVMVMFRIWLIAYRSPLARSTVPERLKAPLLTQLIEIRPEQGLLWA